VTRPGASYLEENRALGWLAEGNLKDPTLVPSITMRARGRPLEKERKAMGKEAEKLERQLDALEKQIAREAPPRDEIEANIDGLYCELLRIKRLHVYCIKDFTSERGVGGIDAYNRDCAWYNRKTTDILQEIDVLERKQQRKR
jgi:hypothetical protein